MTRFRLWLHRILAAWIVDDPNPTYSTLDQADGLRLCHLRRTGLQDGPRVSGMTPHKHGHPLNAGVLLDDTTTTHHNEGTIMATIRDVANATGYSKETVRQVMSGADGWTPGPEVTATIQAASKELGYVYRERQAAAGAGLGVRMYSGLRDPETGQIGREALDKKAKREYGGNLTATVHDMLTYAFDNMPPRKKTRAKAK